MASSNLPTRRLLRATRTTAIKENENANAKPSRIATRTKAGALTSGTSASAAPVGGITRPTAASKAKALTADPKADLPAGKRKREALGEVAVAGNKPSVAGVNAGKGKQKETFDGVVLKPRSVTARPSLKTVATRQTSLTAREHSTTNKEIKIEVDNKEHAMVVDPVQIRSLTTRRSNLPAESISVAPRRTNGARISSRHASASSRVKIELEEEDEEEPVHKKRRTSSLPPDEELEVELTEEEAHQARLEAEMDAFANEEEADPETSAWDDLDAEDIDDPLMVSEYVQDIFKYMKQLEITTMPNPNYMESQKELAWKMRGILTDWLIQVHVRFRLLPETLFLAVNIIDRFLSARVVSLAKLQLVGVTCLFVAAKFEEIVAPSVSHFLMCADSSYTEPEILQAERYVLKTLDWNLSYPNPVHFLRRVSKADEYNVKVRTLAKYLLEVGVLEWRLIAAPPSLMAAASIWLARLALGMENWSPNLAHYSSYKESQLIPTANLMLNYILKPIRHESFHKKYAGKRFFKSSVFMREWALDRWSEGAQVDLTSELCRIKAEIKLERDAEEAAQLMREDSRDLAAEYAALQQLRARAAMA